MREDISIAICSRLALTSETFRKRETFGAKNLLTQVDVCMSVGLFVCLSANLSEHTHTQLLFPPK